MFSLRLSRWTHAYDICINSVLVTRIVSSYTCLDQSFPVVPDGRQKIGLDNQRATHSLYLIINQQHASNWRQSYTKQIN